MKPTVVLNCDGVANGTGRTDTEVVNFTVDFLVVIAGDVDATLQLIEDLLQQDIAPGLVGCPDTTARRLQQADADIVNVVFDVQEDEAASGTFIFTVRVRNRRRILEHDTHLVFNVTASCSSQIEDGQCTGADVNVDMYHTGGDSDNFGTLLFESILAKCDELKSLPGVADMLNPCATLTVTRNTPLDEDDDEGDDEGGVSGIVGGQEPVDEGLNAGGFVGVAIGGLILVLLLLFFVRHRRSDSNAVKHYQLEDVMDDETYLRDIDGETMPSSPGSYDDGVRQSYILGEDDSIMSGWSGHTRRLDGGANLLRTRPTFDGGQGNGLYKKQDVHKCSSAMCEVCETQRQSGLQFVPSGMPSHASVPRNASRSYLAKDTVDL